MALLGKYRDKIDAVLNDTVWKDPFSALKTRWATVRSTVNALTQGSPPPDPGDWTTVTGLMSDISDYLGDSGDGDEKGVGATSLKTMVSSANDYFKKTTMDRMRVGDALSDINKKIAILDGDGAPGEDGDGCQIHMAILMGAVSQITKDWLGTNTTGWESTLSGIPNPVTSTNVSTVISGLTSLRGGVSGKKTSYTTKINDAENKYLAIIEEVKAASFITSFEDMWDDPCLQAVLNNVVDTAGWGLP